MYKLCHWAVLAVYVGIVEHVNARVAQARPGNGAARADAASSMKETSWNPPAYLSRDLDAVWNHTIATYSPKPDPLRFSNYGFNQVFATKGRINFCVRWDSSRTATPELRSQIAQSLKTQTKKWIDVLSGFDNWPYPNVRVQVTGWAARNEAQIPRLTNAEGRFYRDRDKQGIPQCSEACGRFFNQNGQYPRCQGGAEQHYDMSLWLTDGFRGGAGGDWGQRLETSYFLNSMNKKDVHIFLHEMGHTFGLNDYYTWKPPTQKNFVMMAGSATYITEFDAWMLRDWWRHLRPRLLN